MTTGALTAHVVALGAPDAPQPAPDRLAPTSFNTLFRRCKWELLGLLCLAFLFYQGDRAIYGVVATEIQAIT